MSPRRSLVPWYLNPNGQRVTRSDLLLPSYFCAMSQFWCASLDMPTSGGFTHTDFRENCKSQVAEANFEFQSSFEDFKHLSWFWPLLPLA